MTDDDFSGDVFSGNADQLAAWDGETGALWSDYADRFEAGVAGYREAFLAAAAVSAGEAVLDVGCGGGRTTRDLARAAGPSGSALGVDLSSTLLDRARRLAADEGVTTAAFEHADAQTHRFPEAAFDLVASRNGAMFFADPAAAFANLARATRPGGRLLLQTWQPFAVNEWLRTFFALLDAGRDLPAPPADAPSPFALSDPDRVRRLLAAAGFRDVALDPRTAAMFVGDDPDDALAFVTAQHAGRLRELDDATRTRVVGDLRADLAAHQRPEGVYYDSAAWFVTARR